jgi:hypothetical protein
MRRFYLYRLIDASGMSGIGVVADGVCFPTNECVISWRTYANSLGIYKSPEDLLTIHGHGGKTIIEWIDTLTPDTEC